MQSVITTNRLLLTPLSRNDLEPLRLLWIEPGVRRFLFDDHIVSTEQVEREIEESARLFQSLGGGLWKAALRGSDELIGFSGYRFFHQPPQLQLLYGFHPDHWAQGLSTEAARAMLRFGFEQLRFERVIASADAPNVASLRVMEKAGMKLDRRETVDGLDTVFYRIEREDFKPYESLFVVSTIDS